MVAVLTMHSSCSSSDLLKTSEHSLGLSSKAASLLGLEAVGLRIELQLHCLRTGRSLAVGG
jgi:hypothetical protein